MWPFGWPGGSKAPVGTVAPIWDTITLALDVCTMHVCAQLTNSISTPVIGLSPTCFQCYLNFLQFLYLCLSLIMLSGSLKALKRTKIRTMPFFLHPAPIFPAICFLLKHAYFSQLHACRQIGLRHHGLHV